MAKNSLPQLNDDPSKVFGSIYSIALEGWRRGLTLTFFGNAQHDTFDIQFSLQSETKDHLLQLSKEVMEEYVEKAGISIPKDLDSDDAIDGDIAKEIIDYYFPETIGRKRNDDFYFDFNQIYEVLRKGLISEIVVSEIPDGEYIIKNFEAYGDVDTKRFDNWLLRYTLNLNIHGYAKDLDNGLKQIVVYGDKDNVVKFVKLLEKHVPLMKDTESLELNPPLKSGFEIIN